MALFAWKDGFRTGIAHMDEQHRKFFHLVNELDLAIEQGREDDILDLLLGDLDRYVRIHFSTEEKLMEGIGFPELARHRKEHEYFVGQLKALHLRRETGDDRTGRSALAFMTDWFTNHILAEDKQYGEFLFRDRPW